VYWVVLTAEVLLYVLNLDFPDSLSENLSSTLTS